MSESKGNYWPYIFLALLCFAIGTLLSIEKEIKAQRSPEQVASIEAQEKIKREAKAYMATEQEKQMERYRNTAWGDLKSDEYLGKFFAENYHIPLIGLIIIVSGPILMRKAQPY